jgi:hypothetical protein
VSVNPNGANGVHPLVKVMMSAEAEAADLARLGLDPMSAAKLWRPTV